MQEPYTGYNNASFDTPFFPLGSVEKTLGSSREHLHYSTKI